MLYKYVLFSGGGIKGISQIGAMDALMKYGFIKAEGYLGSSVGSILATLFACGYTVEELKRLMTEINFHDYKEIDFKNFLTNFGLDNGQKLMKLFRIMIKQKMGEKTTFKELYEYTRKLLVITGSCINTGDTTYFDHINYPDMQVIEAIRISISIPGYYTMPTFGNYSFTDGAISDNMPFTYLSDEQIKESIGIQLYDGEIIEKIESVEDYASALLKCVAKNTSKTILNKYPENVIKVDMSDISALDFNMDKEQKQAMFQRGYDSAKEFIDDKLLKLSVKQTVKSFTGIDQYTT